VAGNRDDSPRGPVLGAAAVLSLGFQLLASALGGFFLGSLLDRGWRTSAFAPAGLLLGLLVGFHRAYVLIKSTIRKRR